MIALIKLVNLFIFVGIQIIAIKGRVVIIEGVIDTANSIVEISKPSSNLIKRLQERFKVPVSDIFELPGLNHIPLLDVEAIEGPAHDMENAVLISESPDGTDSFLMAAISLPRNILQRLLGRSSFFLRTLLPTDILNQNEDRPSLLSRVANVTSSTGHMTNFFNRFMKFDLNSSNEFIPESLFNVLRTIQQAIIHPTTYLLAAEDPAEKEEDISHKINVATPVDLILGMFERVF